MTNLKKKIVVIVFVIYFFKKISVWHIEKTTWKGGK